MNVLLKGIVGSTAYGLATEDSDVDRLAVFAEDTEKLLGLIRPSESLVTTKPDVTMHEAVKFCRLALKCNPTVTELLWLPEELYEHRTDLGEELINIRSAFLSATYVRNAYFGYATQQFERLERRGDGTFGPDLAKRTAKHARHMYRLLEQGFGLWVTGHLEIRLPEPERAREFGERVADGDVSDAKRLLASFETAFDSVPTALPDAPEEPTVEGWLLDVRRSYYRDR